MSILKTVHICICSFNLNNPESTVFIAFILNSIASGNNLLLNGIIGNSMKYIAFYKTHSGLGLLGYVHTVLDSVMERHRKCTG